MIQAGTNTRIVVEMTGNHKFEPLFKALERAGISILSASLYPSVQGNYAGLALITNDTDGTITLLEQEHMPYKKRPVFAVEMGTTRLGDAIKALLDAGYDVENGVRVFFADYQGKAWAIFAPTAPKDYNKLVTALKTFVTEAVPA